MIDIQNDTTSDNTEVSHETAFPVPPPLEIPRRRRRGGVEPGDDAAVTSSEVAATEKPGPQPAGLPPSIAIFDRAMVIKQLRLATATGEYIGENDLPVVLAASSDEQTRIERLRALAADTPDRPLVVGDTAMRDRLAQLRGACPGFVEVIALVDRAVALSAMTGGSITIPPLLLVGEPGLGKTHFSKHLAAALSIEQHAFSCATNSDAQALVIGHPPTWRGARMGVVTEALLGGETANPLILLDEIDKFVTHSTEKPYNALLALLEPENACALVDEYLRVPFNCSRCLIVATANDLDALPDFIRDRFLIIAIAPPDGDTLRAIAQRVAADLIAIHAASFSMPDDAVIARLGKTNPRGIRRIVGLALGFAAAAGRNHLIPDDVVSAESSSSPGIRSHPVGFITARRD